MERNERFNVTVARDQMILQSHAELRMTNKACERESLHGSNEIQGLLLRGSQAHLDGPQNDDNLEDIRTENDDERSDKRLTSMNAIPSL
jgi:hypothetical protein